MSSSGWQHDLDRVWQHIVNDDYDPRAHNDHLYELPRSYAASGDWREGALRVASVHTFIVYGAAWRRHELKRSCIPETMIKEVLEDVYCHLVEPITQSTSCIDLVWLADRIGTTCRQYGIMHEPVGPSGVFEHWLSQHPGARAMQLRLGHYAFPRAGVRTSVIDHRYAEATCFVAQYHGARAAMHAHHIQPLQPDDPNWFQLLWRDRTRSEAHYSLFVPRLDSRALGHAAATDLQKCRAQLDLEREERLHDGTYVFVCQSAHAQDLTPRWDAGHFFMICNTPRYRPRPALWASLADQLAHVSAISMWVHGAERIEQVGILQLLDIPLLPGQGLAMHFFRARAHLYRGTS